MIICPQWRVLRLPRAEEKLREEGGKRERFRMRNNETKGEGETRQPDEEREKFGERRKRGREREEGEETVKLSAQRHEREKKQDSE